MTDGERILEELEDWKRCGYAEMFPFYYPILDDVIELLKEQKESIPISWLEEKLEGHPEIPYTVTDGINHVLDLWESR